LAQQVSMLFICLVLYVEQSRFRGTSTFVAQGAHDHSKLFLSPTDAQCVTHPYTLAGLTAVAIETDLAA